MVLPFLVQGSRSLLKLGMKNVNPEEIQANNELFDLALGEARSAVGTLTTTTVEAPESGTYWAEINGDNHMYPVYCFKLEFSKEESSDEETGGSSANFRISGTCLDPNSRLLQIQEGKVLQDGSAYWIASRKGTEATDTTAMLSSGTFQGKKFEGKYYARDSRKTGTNYRSFRWAKPTTISGSVVKSTIESQCGISFLVLPNGGLAIRRVIPDSLFASTDLKEGMKVVSIQGQTEFQSSKEAADLIRASTGEVTVVAFA